jgi:hypothetical protein
METDRYPVETIRAYHASRPNFTDLSHHDIPEVKRDSFDLNEAVVLPDLLDWHILLEEHAIEAIALSHAPHAVLELGVSHIVYQSEWTVDI